MTQVWVGDKVQAVTPVEAGPCVVVQIKNTESDGYQAVQLGFGVRKEKNIRKPQVGHLAKSGAKGTRHLREFRVDSLPDLKLGDLITVDTFAADDVVDAIGVSKGKGFQGVVKRHGFHGFRKTHGNKDQERHSGSVGPKGPAHVFKGTRMGGQMGDEQVTIKNLSIISVDSAANILYIKGAIPGGKNGLILIKGQGELKIAVPEEVKEEIKPEENIAAESVAEVTVEPENMSGVDEVPVEETPAPTEENQVAA